MEPIFCMDLMLLQTGGSDGANPAKWMAYRIVLQAGGYLLTCVAVSTTVLCTWETRTCHLEGLDTAVWVPVMVRPVLILSLTANRSSNHPGGWILPCTMHLIRKTIWGS